MRQRTRDQLGQLRARHADQLTRRAGRIGQRAEQVERGAHAELLARLAPHAASTGETSGRRRTRCPPRRGSVRRRRRRRDVDAERLEQVGAAAAARHRPVAMLGDAHAARGQHQRGDGRDIERVRSVAAGAAGVEHRMEVFDSLVARARIVRASPTISPAARLSSPGRSAARRSATTAARPSMISSMAADASSTVRSCRRCSFSIRVGKHRHSSRKFEHLPADRRSAPTRDGTARRAPAD